MGIFCQINLVTLPDIAFQPGETVSGTIKYAVHEPVDFERITTSLKGNGQLKVRVKSTNSNKENTYTSSENYVDIDHIVNTEKVAVPVGCHEIQFAFKIPDKIPSTLDYKRNFAQYSIKCRIIYYIRIKFERPGWFTLPKHFRKEIIVVSGITPQLLMEPVIYGEAKKLMRLFSRKNAIVSIKATILNSVIPDGGKIQLNYEVKNDTNIVIKNVETKLVEVYTFKAIGHPEVKAYQDVPDTYTKTGYIESGITKTRPLEIDVPMERVSLPNSTLVRRDYVVRITAELPMPHRNILLDIPVQIGSLPGSGAFGGQSGACNVPVSCEEPPSYWEVMGEANGDQMSDGLGCDFEKGEKSNPVETA